MILKYQKKEEQKLEGDILTLILTELNDTEENNYGIVMAADTALTVQSLSADKRYIERVYHGAIKLLKIPKLNAGISWWGKAKINEIDTDIWLGDFIIAKEEKYDSLNDFAILLQEDLRKYVPIIDKKNFPSGERGFHLAGFVNGQKLPAFYHIHNATETGIIGSYFDCPPDKFLELSKIGKNYITRNGDYQPFAIIKDMLKDIFEIYFPKIGIEIPYPSTLDTRANYLRFQIKLMSELYKISNRKPIIGGQITTLTISSNGIERYETF